MKKRLAFDAALTLLLVFEMFIQYTGDILHEIVGFAFFATIVAHLVVERRWIAGAVRTVDRRPLGRKRAVLLGVAIALAADLIALIVSSVIISNLLYAAGLNLLFLNLTGIWTLVHAVSSYALCALVVVHLALHWSMVASVFHVSYSPSRREAIGRGIGAVAALGIVAIGATMTSSVNALAPLAGSGGEDALAGSGNSGEADAFAAVGDSASVDAADAGSDSATASAMLSKGKRHRGQATGTATTDSSIVADPPASSSDSAGDSSASSAHSSESTDTVSGTCPLCPKSCPLSDPECNKPYDAGLISP